MRFLTIFAVVPIALGLNQCAPRPRSGSEGGVSPSSSAADGAVRWLISDLRQTCTGVGPMECLVYRNAETGLWSMLYSGIEGFAYDPNYAVELEVRTERVDNPPADGSSIRYIQVREVARHKVQKLDGVINDAWGVVELNGRPLQKTENVFFEINQRTGSMMGRGGCNHFSAPFRLYDSHYKGISVGALTHTEIACDQLELEQEFFEALGTVNRIDFSRAEVRLLHNDEVLVRGLRID